MVSVVAVSAASTGAALLIRPAAATATTTSTTSPTSTPLAILLALLGRQLTLFILRRSIAIAHVGEGVITLAA